MESPSCPEARIAPAARRFNDVVERVGRDERQRVVPLPLTFAAILLPFLAAWATAGEMEDRVEVVPMASPVAARATPAALMVLDRTRRIPADPGGYVDIYGPAAPWEAELLTRRGYTRPPASAECRAYGDDGRNERGE